MSWRDDGQAARPRGSQTRRYWYGAALIGAAALLVPTGAAWADAKGGDAKAGDAKAGDAKAGVDDWARGDYAGAIREWQAGVARGDADAEFNMGQAYMLGKGVPRDLVRAEALFAKASAQGHLRASDNYGLLLFQRGEHAKAMPYIKQAADRGDARAQYLLGLALFNGETMPKDWVRAYALVNLAQQSGLPQAKPALAQMDQYIPLEQRRRGVALAGDLAAQAEANRARQVASEDLGVRAQPVPQPLPAPGSALAAGGDAPPSPYTAAPGPSADMAPPGPAPMAPTRTKPAPKPHVAPTPHPTPLAMATPVEKPVPAKAPPAKPTTLASGEWRIQFGAFSVSGNADALWNRLKSRVEVSGHARIEARNGAVTKLQAGGYSKEAAAAACQTLRAAGLTCVLAKD